MKNRFASESLIIRGHIAELNTQPGGDSEHEHFSADLNRVRTAFWTLLTHRWTRPLLTDTIPEPLVSEDEARFSHAGSRVAQSESTRAEQRHRAPGTL
ncbi:hypothetical protein PHYPO_G00077280 [Pangasianodon hypophthalmus]|uniref:Uncharacterized protein n=1 Tax=Pangasianodon hypophthalmus TaxID=310915 RepID=A0A5N5LMD5_PANHP|nr:hypothetical protein PHYPO_G00077280 [Pangasianodon hypophthalmus]